MNIAFLIPATSKGKNWKIYTDSILFKNTLSTFKTEKGNNYFFFIGYDHDDSYYKNTEIQKNIKKQFSKFIFYFIEFPNDIYPNHLTKMWNVLLERAYNLETVKIQYFYQCGDDIIFKNEGWVKQSMKTLQMHGNIGITGPSNEHPELLTQVFFSRKHYDIFKFLFPPYIFNWGCDDWINKVYSPNYIYPLTKFYAENAGGPPRYDISKYDLIKLKKMASEKANLERKKLQMFLSKS